MAKSDSVGLSDSDKLAVANQLQIVVVNKQQKEAIVIDAAISSDGKFRKKEHQKLKTAQVPI